MEKAYKAQGELDTEKSETTKWSSASVSQLNAKHQQLINQHLPIAIVEVSLEGNYLDVNETFCNMLGYEKAELLQRGIRDVTPAQDYQADIQLLGRLVKGEIPYYKIEKRFERKDGRLIWVEMTRSAVRDENGKVLYIVGIRLDITERKQLEEALRSSELLYREIARSIPGGGVYVLDKNLRYLVAEGSPTRAYGLAPKDVEGHTVAEIFTSEYRELVENNLKRAFAGEIVSSETVYNGRVYWSQYAMMNEELGYAIIITLDITERKQVLEALQESEGRFSAILSQASAGIVRKATDGTLLFVNDAFCRMVGYTSPELVSEGKTCWDLTHPDDVEENKRLFERMITEGIPFHMERRIIRKDGSILWTDVSVSPVMDTAGYAVLCVGVEVDITARKQAEASIRKLNLELESRVEERTAELKAMNEALQKSRQHLQTLSQRLVQVQEEERRALARELHDRVGQSLIALNLNLTIIRSELAKGNTEQLGTRLTDSIQLVSQVITLVRDVMSNLRPANLDDYGLESALQTYINEFQTRYGIPVLFEKRTPPIPQLGNNIEITLLRISQEALMNIARHAQATQAELALRLDEQQVYLTITDNGVGIHSSQGSKQTRSHGLKIMQERAEALKGTLHIQSTPGQGTKIEVIIPLAQQKPNTNSLENLL